MFPTIAGGFGKSHKHRVSQSSLTKEPKAVADEAFYLRSSVYFGDPQGCVRQHRTIRPF